MARIVIAGAGVCGLAAGLMLRRDGHEVTVLERDPSPTPDTLEDAWEAWERGGVAQFRQAHYMQPLGRAVLDAELPDISAALLDAGGVRFDTLTMMPPTILDRSPRPGDERFVTVTARRTTVEHVLACAAERELDVRRGVAIAALRDAPDVTGVTTTTGETVPADLVVDAMGRRSRLPQWLDGVREEAEDCGFLYYTRFFRGDAMPQVRAPINMPIGTISILTLPADGLTWSVTIYATTGDQALKRLRDADAWTAVVRSLPLHAHWLDGVPMTGVLPMGGIVDRYRRLPPEVTGVALLADACACTNPSLGRGMALGIRHAQRLRDTLRAHGDHPRELAEAWDEATREELVPWYRATVTVDRDRLRDVEAMRAGRPRPQPADRAARLRAAVMPAAMRDPDVFRAMLAQRACLGRPDALERDELAERILELARDAGPPRLAGPDREQLVALAV
jgi:2-polyprenyl-6-methoxyphenol hydroxylase-like FAD-dependent oxidoreductase